MLQAYRIIGRGFHVGAGALVLLSAAQAMERIHKLDPVGKAGDGFGLVRAKEVQAFKAGEVLGLAEMPKGQLHLVEELAITKRAKKDEAETDMEAALCHAVAAFNDAAVQAEKQQQRAADEANKQRLKEAAAAADAADAVTWTHEFNTVAGVKDKHGKVETYIAFRRAEKAKG